MTTTSLGDVTFSIPYGTSADPFKVTTIRTIDGYCGQVIFRGDIVWQSKPHKKSSKALHKAQRHLQQRISDVLA